VKSPISTALLAIALLASPLAAAAAPATVTVFEAQVHAAPDFSSPVIHTFAENTRVSVSEQAEGGFRKVRLPDGRVGYIEESALSIAGAAPTTPPPPEPPPAFQPPPPPPPPPPYARYPRYYADPTAFRHMRFFLRLDLGLGYMGSSTSPTATALGFDSSRGPAGAFGVALGGAVKENFILAGHFWGTWVSAPNLYSSGTEYSTGGDSTTSLVGFGPSFTWYFMPNNIYVTLTPSLTWLNFDNPLANVQTSAGFGTWLSLGKEWWVGPHWGLGVSGWFVMSFNRESDGGGPTWRSFGGGLGFSSTFN